ncbi:MAG: YggT family protein [Desulfuromonadales bacterium]|nr:YggT family protein [Desulfuromonadales bacterium]MDT8424308.1 YggT family protein [Desulfuromonadales bacterium]
MELLLVLLRAVAAIANLVIQLYIYVVIARALVSWVNPDPYNPIVRFLHNATDPLLDRLRRILPLNFGGMDFTPIALLIALEISRQLIMTLLTMIMRTLTGY